MNDFQSFIKEASRLIASKRRLTAAQNLIKRTAAAKPCEILRNDETYAYTIATILQSEFPELMAVYKADGPLAPVAYSAMKDLADFADMVASVAVQRVNERNADKRYESAIPDDWRHF